MHYGQPMNDGSGTCITNRNDVVVDHRAGSDSARTLYVSSLFIRRPRCHFELASNNPPLPGITNVVMERTEMHLGKLLRSILCRELDDELLLGR